MAYSSYVSSIKFGYELWLAEKCICVIVDKNFGILTKFDVLPSSSGWEVTVFSVIVCSEVLVCVVAKCNIGRIQNVVLLLQRRFVLSRVCVCRF